jgi:hypothetical protein
MVHGRPMISFKADFMNWMHHTFTIYKKLETKTKTKTEEGISMPC